MTTWSARNAVFDRARAGHEIAGLWGAHPDTLRLVNDGINIVYRFESGGRGKYLKVCHALNRSQREHRAAVEYLRHLADDGADVCAPVPSVNGRLIEEFRQGGDTFLAWASLETPGRAISLDAPSADEFRAWGVSLGKMHRAAETYAPPDGVTYLAWEDLWRQTRDGIPADDAIGARTEMEALDGWLRSLPRGSGAFGLTHTDVRSENATWDGGRAWIIDFDEPVYHWYASDVMRPFLEYAHLPRQRFDALFNSFLDGYRSERTFDDAWVAELPRFARMKNLGFYWWDAANGREDRPGYGEWLEGIRRRLGAPELWLGPERDPGGLMA